MEPQIGNTVLHSERKQNNSTRPINWDRSGGEEDIIIAGAVSEWVLMGLQKWRRVARAARVLGSS